MIEKIILPPARLFQSSLAEVVAASLDEHRGEFVGIQRLDERNILVDQLFLKRDSVRGDDDALFLPHREVDRGQKVGERLADARAGLDKQMMPVCESLLDRAGHLKLLRSMLIF